jgi:hypothetical protein
VTESPLVEVLLEATRALTEARVPHALIGGVACILHGGTRATRDVDLSITLEMGDLPTLDRRLVAHGFEGVTLRGSVVQARHTSGHRLDLLIAQSAFELAVLASAAPRSLAGGPEIALASLPALVVFKLVGGRPGTGGI